MNEKPMSILIKESIESFLDKVTIDIDQRNSLYIKLCKLIGIGGYQDSS